MFCQTAERLLGLHRDRVAACLLAEEPASARSASLGRQLALVLRLLCQLRAQPPLLTAALLSRALCWLSGAGTELRQLQRRPAPAGQLPGLRRLLVRLEGRLAADGERLLSALPAPCRSALRPRLAELRGSVAVWSAYTGQLLSEWRRLQLLETAAAGEEQLAEADRLRAALRGLLTEDSGRPATAEHRARRLLLTLADELTGQTEADTQTARTLSQTR